MQGLRVLRAPPLALSRPPQLDDLYDKLRDSVQNELEELYAPNRFCCPATPSSRGSRSRAAQKHRRARRPLTHRAAEGDEPSSRRRVSAGSAAGSPPSRGRAGRHRRRRAGERGGGRRRRVDRTPALAGRSRRRRCRDGRRRTRSSQAYRPRLIRAEAPRSPAVRSTRDDLTEAARPGDRRKMQGKSLLEVVDAVVWRRSSAASPRRRFDARDAEMIGVAPASYELTHHVANELGCCCAKMRCANKPRRRSGRGRRRQKGIAAEPARRRVAR